MWQLNLDRQPMEMYKQYPVACDFISRVSSLSHLLFSKVS